MEEEAARNDESQKETSETDPDDGYCEEENSFESRRTHLSPRSKVGIVDEALVDFG